MPSSTVVDVARLWAPDNLRKVAAGTAVSALIAAVAFTADVRGWTHFGNVFVHVYLAIVKNFDAFVIWLGVGQMNGDPPLPSLYFG